jgi:soluble lytic murein transglycosylase
MSTRRWRGAVGIYRTIRACCTIARAGRSGKGRQSDELSYLLRINGEQAPAVGREDIWGEKQSVMRRMIRERDYQKAYQLAAGHGLLSGEAFRDAEWMAGWLALEKLGDAREGRGAFPRVRRGRCDADLCEPGAILAGRGADQAATHSREAQEAYAVASKYPYVFYGQLAAEKVRQQMPEAMKMLFRPARAADR